jgi:hypothetical protein
MDPSALEQHRVGWVCAMYRANVLRWIPRRTAWRSGAR